MTPNTLRRSKVDPKFTENYNNLSVEFWDRYRGKHVAFRLDGTDVMAAGDSYGEVIEQLKQKGIDPSETVLDYMEDLG